MPASKGALDAFYQTVMKRNSTYMLFVLSGAFVGEKVVDAAGNGVWKACNSGKVWGSVKQNLPKLEDDE